MTTCHALCVVQLTKNDISWLAQRRSHQQGMYTYGYRKIMQTQLSETFLYLRRKSFIYTGKYDDNDRKVIKEIRGNMTHEL